MLQAIQHRKGVLRTSITFCVTSLCLLVLGQQIAQVNMAEVQSALQGITLWQWALALGATAISFLAVGQYDVVWHRQLDTGAIDQQARISGMAAIAVGQTVGLGAVTGTFVRWHVLPAQSLKTAAAVTISVSLSFLICWAVFGTIAAFSLGVITMGQALGLLCLGGSAVITILWRSNSLLSKMRLAALMTLTGIDIAFAGVALWILMPTADTGLLFTVIAAYVLALGAGLISNAPGGVGAFELVLLGLLTTTPESAVLAGVLAFRIVYYIIPALCGGCLMLRAQLIKPTGPENASSADPITDLCNQGAYLHQGWVTRHHLLGRVAIEPSGSNLTRPSSKLGFQAFYKCCPRLAAIARRQGWQVRLIARNAIVDPTAWQIDSPQCRSLRRKLRQAEKTGVRITRTEGALPLANMDTIAATWSAQNKGELGYAMGRYEHRYVARQQVYLIWHNQRLCGFVSAQTRAQSWGLDLIRHLPDMPTGAMHLALTTMIADAGAAGVRRLNLGAIPDGPEDALLQQHCARQKAGLRQFKASFAPRWEPRYHAAPNRLQWALSMLFICNAIQRPLPRALGHVRETITNLIKKAKIIHLPHNVGSGIERLSPARERPTR